MNVYGKLSIVDQFEEKSGNREAVIRACDLMTRYLMGLKRPLPEIATAGLHVASKFRSGQVNEKDLLAGKKKVSFFLRERGWTNYRDPDCALTHAVYAILNSYLEPDWGGGASELISNCLDMTENIGNDEELFEQLLEEIFSAN